MTISDVNKNALLVLKSKVQRDYSKLRGTKDWLDKKEGQLEKIGGDYLTFKTEENKRALIGSAMVPGALFAVSALSFAFSLIVVLPKALPPTSEHELEVFSKLEKVGGEILKFSGNSFNDALKSFIIPLGVTTLSISKKFFDIIVDKVSVKTDKMKNTMDLINDLDEEENDETLDFTSKFLRRVDINENSVEFNNKLFEHLASYRYWERRSISAKNNEEKNIAERGMAVSYYLLIKFLISSKINLGASSNFKKNRHVNTLIEKYKESFDNELNNQEDEKTENKSPRR